MKLLLTGSFAYSEAQLTQIKSLGCEVSYIEDERKPLEADFSGIEAVVCNNLFFYHDIANFKNLKLIQLLSAGLDRVPLEYINEKGIQLYNAGDVYSIPMAEWAVLKILEIYKQSRFFYQNQDQHRWQKNRDLLELTGKKVAIIGLGKIGLAIAERLKPFGVEISAVDIMEVKSESVDRLWMFEDLDQVLGTSDIVILTLPLTEQTRHLINARRLKLIPDQGVLINLSRGAVADEAALIETLQTGKFRGVAIDVFEEEPLPAENPLWGFDNVIITPHNSYVSELVTEKLFTLIFANLEQYMNR